jgi:hypothetical protein
VLHGPRSAGRGSRPHSAASLSTAPVLRFTHVTLRVACPPLQATGHGPHGPTLHSHGSVLHVVSESGRGPENRHAESASRDAPPSLLQNTSRTARPPPQRAEHGPHANAIHCVKIHDCWLHGSLVAGAGPSAEQLLNGTRRPLTMSTQNTLRLRKPPPHSAEHEPHAVAANCRLQRGPV